MLPHQSTASGPQLALAGNISDNSEQKDEYCLCEGTDDGRPMISCDHCNNWLGTSLRAPLSLSNTEKPPGFILRALGWMGRLLLSWVSDRA